MPSSASQYVRRNAIAFLALFVALGGTATATHLAVDGSDVIDESLTGDDIRGSSAAAVEGTIKGEDVKDGTLNAKNLAIGAVNSLRVSDGSLTGTDVEDKSLSSADLDVATRETFFVRSHRSEEMLLDVRYGTVGVGDVETAATMTRHTASGGGTSTQNLGWVVVNCTETGYSVTYESHEFSGHQRVWYDNGSSVRYRTVAAEGTFTVLDSSASIPEARHVTLHAHSINRDVDAVFDLMVVRLQQGRGDPCLWHVSATSRAKP